MPDILEINREIQRRVMGAEVTLGIYEFIGETDIVSCPQVLVRVQRDKPFQAYVHFLPEAWEAVTPEFIGKWFENALEAVV